MEKQKSLLNMCGVRKKGVISNWYVHGLISEKDLVIYSRAVELYKNSEKSSLEDWLKLPKNSNMYSADRSKCKLYWIEKSKCIFE